MLRRSSRVTRQSSWICGIPSASFVPVRVTRLAGLGSCSHRTRAVATVFVVTPWAASSSIPRRVPGKSSSTRGSSGGNGNSSVTSQASSRSRCCTSGARRSTDCRAMSRGAPSTSTVSGVGVYGAISASSIVNATGPPATFTCSMKWRPTRSCSFPMPAGRLSFEASRSRGTSSPPVATTYAVATARERVAGERLHVDGADRAPVVGEPEPGDVRPQHELDGGRPRQLVAVEDAEPGLGGELDDGVRRRLRVQDRHLERAACLPRRHVVVVRPEPARVLRDRVVRIERGARRSATPSAARSSRGSKSSSGNGRQ